MRHNRNRNIWFVFLSAVFMLACVTVLGGKPDAPPVQTQPPVQMTQPPVVEDTPTMPEPTAEPATPTEALDLAATQKADEFTTTLEKFRDNGYISTTEGNRTALEDFKEDWAQIGWFQWWKYDVETTEEFVFKAHFKWSTASSTPDPSGCGFIFGIQENKDYYAVFLDNKRIYFYMHRGKLYSVGKTSGSGMTSFDNPAESDFAVAVSHRRARVAVDGNITTYTLSEDQGTSGKMGLSLLSGTNLDYGTRCEATNMMLWNAK